MKKKLLLYVCTFLFSAGVAVSGCGSGNADKSGSASQTEIAYDDTAEQEALAADPNLFSTNHGEELSSTTSSASDENGTEDAKATGSEILTSENTASLTDHTNEKLIHTYHYTTETKEYEAFLKQITEQTKQLNGYIESSETNGGTSDRSNRYADITLRIPAGEMDAMLSMIQSKSNVTYSKSSVENVTLQYVDMQSHVKALRTEQNTLLELIEKADKLKDIIALQSQLTQVRYEIESYESQLRMYDNRVNYSTLNLTVCEVERATTVTPAKAGFLEEVKNKFSDNLYAVGQWLRALAIWLIGSLPILLPAAFAVIAALLLLRKWNKRKKRRLAETPSTSSGYQSIYQSQKTKREADPQTQKETKPTDETERH